MKLTVSTAARETLSREPQSKSSSRPCAHAQWRKMARRGRCTRGSGAACEKAEVCVRGARWRRGRAAGGGRRAGGPGAPAVGPSTPRDCRSCDHGPRPQRKERQRRGDDALAARLRLPLADGRLRAARGLHGAQQLGAHLPRPSHAGSVIWSIGCARAGWLLETGCYGRAGSAHQRVAVEPQDLTTARRCRWSTGEAVGGHDLLVVGRLRVADGRRGHGGHDDAQTGHLREPGGA